MLSSSSLVPHLSILSTYILLRSASTTTTWYTYLRTYPLTVSVLPPPPLQPPTHPERRMTSSIPIPTSRNNNKTTNPPTHHHHHHRSSPSSHYSPSTPGSSYASSSTSLPSSTGGADAYSLSSKGKGKGKEREGTIAQQERQPRRESLLGMCCLTTYPYLGIARGLVLGEGERTSSSVHKADQSFSRLSQEPR